MPNIHFQFRQFRIDQAFAGMKVTTDACLFGAWAADQLASEPANKVLDIGTGTGLLTLMLAQKSTSSHFDAIEIERDAYLEAKRNFAASPWHGRIATCLIDVQSYTPSYRYEVIICNPPFFHHDSTGTDKRKNDALHAHRLSMDDLAVHVSRLLQPDGVLYLLYPPYEMQQFIKVAERHNLHEAYQMHVAHDSKKTIFRTIATFQNKRTTVYTETLHIYDKKGVYSKDFWRLLEGYYLPYNAPQ